MARESTSPCKYCRELIAWASTDSGKRIPLDLEPVKDGEWLLFEQRDHELRAERFDPNEPIHGAMKRFRSHHKSCQKSPHRHRAVEHCLAPGCFEPCAAWEVACQRYKHAEQLPDELRGRLERLWRTRPAGKEHAAAVEEARQVLARAAGSGVANGG